jgi:hypothetical protein
MTVDAAGKPHLVYSIGDGGRVKSILATLERDGSWRRRDLNVHLPERWKDWDLTMAGGVTFNGREEMTITAQVQKVRDNKSSWGHATNEVVRFRSTDGGESFQFAVVSKPDLQTSNWLPNIERATGHNQVPERPSTLYTAGPPGQKNTELLSNRVYWSDA